jgi:glycosyltransferase involved in cell wall biosynthesis
MSRLLAMLARNVDGAITNSHALANDVRSLLPLIPIETIYNGINTGFFYPAQVSGASLDRLGKLSLATCPVLRIGLVATYARWKGQDIFLEAAARLLRDRPGQSVRFYIVGGPIYQTLGSQFSEMELRSLAGRLGIADHVGFIPFQDQVADIYRALDVVVHASTRPEPFGLTIVEAMACGKPVIVSQAGGAVELFTPGHDAIGVSPGDPAALAAAMQRLIDDPETRRQLGSSARQTAVSRFNQDRLGPQVLAFYDRILQRRSTRNRHPPPPSRPPCR